MELAAESTGLAAGRCGVAAFPLIDENPYQRLLYRELALLGTPLAPSARLSASWLWRSRRTVAALHVHWPNALYRDPADGRAAAAARVALLAVRLAVARLLGYRIVWTVHQVLPHERSRLDRLASLVLARAAHALLVHDGATEERAAGALHARSKLVRVPHGSYAGVYPPGRDRATVRAELGLRPSTTVFIAFGHVRTYKALGVLLDGFDAATADDIALVVAGLGVDDDSASLVRWHAAHDRRIVPLLGFVPDERVAELFGAADVAVVSRGDGGTSGALTFRHHRPEGAREARFRNYAELGATAWFMGYRPSYLALRTGFRALRRPAAAGMLAGYLRSAVTRAPRLDDAGARRHLAERQRLRSLPRRSREARGA